MKKTVTMALTLTMVLGLMSGCGANDTPADNAETNATPANAENFSDEMKIPYAVDLSPEDGADSVERAEAKGATNILALDQSLAFIINVPNGRVITTMSQDEMKENIFTNIDGAVIL